MSKYIDADASVMGAESMPGVIGIAVGRISDHRWDELEKRNERIGPPKKLEIELVRLDVNECMRVRGIDGYVWNWSAFIYEPAKIALMNGQSVMAPNAMSGSSHVIGAKFAIAPDDWKRIEASASLEFSKAFYRFAGHMLEKDWWTDEGTGD